MITMKKKVFLMALVGAALTACSNHDDVYSPEKYAEAKLQAKVAEYNAAFQKEFGTPAPGHTWGFGTSTRSAVTRAADTDGKFWIRDGYDNIPPADTKDYEAAVTEIFRDEAKWKEYQVTGIDFSDFFVQQVHKGTKEDCTYQSYKDQKGERNDVYGPDLMNQLVCQKNDGAKDHVNNFNDANFSHGEAQNYTQVWNGQGGEFGYNDNNNLYRDAIILMKNSGTEAFGWSNNNDNGYYYMDAYVIIEYPKNSGYYYVGFDYYRRSDGQVSANNPDYYINGDKIVDRDYRYDDWIVRITPAKKQKTPETQELFQVWCEDLGGEYGKNGNDFDFNDVVLSFVKNGNNTEIWLLAAGGTMKLDVVWNGESKEVHEAFGVETSVMVNTGRKDVEKKLLWTVPNTIVTRDDLNSKLQIKVMDKETGVWYTLNNSSAAPQMIVCEPEVLWPNERVNINDAFADDAFNNWVTGEPSKPFNGRRK